MGKRQVKFRMIFDYFMLAVGGLLMSVGINLFLAPNVIAPGGVTGFSVVVRELTTIPIYVTNLCINIPLFIFGAKILGKKTAIRTFFTTLVFTLGLKFIPLRPVTGDLLLAAAFGGVIHGLGMGINFKFEGTTGGTDLAGLIFSNINPRLKVSSFMLAINSFVVLLAGVVEGRAEITLYSVIAVYATSKLVDIVLEGPGYSKGFYIITYKPEEVADALMKRLHRGVTALKGKGMYTKEERDVLLCAVHRSEFTAVKEIIQEIDPKAFIMITEMTEVLGEGFTSELSSS